MQKIIAYKWTYDITAMGHSFLALTTRQKHPQRGPNKCDHHSMYVATQRRWASSIGGGSNLAIGDRDMEYRCHRD